LAEAPPFVDSERLVEALGGPRGKLGVGVGVGAGRGRVTFITNKITLLLLSNPYTTLMFVISTVGGGCHKLSLTCFHPILEFFSIRLEPLVSSPAFEVGGVPPAPENFEILADFLRPLSLSSYFRPMEFIR